MKCYRVAALIQHTNNTVVPADIEIIGPDEPTVGYAVDYINHHYGKTVMRVIWIARVKDTPPEAA